MANKDLIKMVKIDPEYYAGEITRLRKLRASVNRENRGCLGSNGCILCGARRKDKHTCGL